MQDTQAPGDEWSAPSVFGAMSAEFESAAAAVLLVAEAVEAANRDPEGVYRNDVCEIAPPSADTPLAELAGRAGLDALEIKLLQLLVAAEQSRHTARALRQLAGAQSSGGFAVGALIAVAEGTGEDPVAAARALSPDGRLCGLGLVDSLGDAVAQQSRALFASPRVIGFLMGASLAESVSPELRLEPANPLEDLCLPTLRDSTAEGPVDLLLRILPRVSSGLPVWVAGPEGLGRRTLLAATAAALDLQLLVMNASDAARIDTRKLTRSLWREVLLYGALLCVVDDGGGVVHSGDGEERSSRAHGSEEAGSLHRRLLAAGLPVLFVSTHPPHGAAYDTPPLVVRLGPPTAAAREAAWHARLPDTDGVEQIAARFQLLPGRIVNATRIAALLAEGRGTPVCAADVSTAVSVLVARQATILGTLVETHVRWEEVVLPAETMDSVREIINRARHRHLVLEEWGFRERLGKGIGIAALFAGPPGTGKTLMASMIARELGQELYRVDLSRIVSKWVGETEKNLAKVFDAADGANVVLLFDEADALFSRRTEVKSSNDRHANAEINYLLQRVESFDGLCVLTTNLESQMDPAFRRRLAFRLNFHMPDEEERVELWRRMIPARAEVASNVDFGDLARRYELSGGNIKNIVLRAAFLAAGDGAPIGMEHLERAVRFEYRDAGKLAAVGRLHVT